MSNLGRKGSQREREGVSISKDLKCKRERCEASLVKEKERLVCWPFIPLGKRAAKSACGRF